MSTTKIIVALVSRDVWMGLGNRATVVINDVWYDAHILPMAVKGFPLFGEPFGDIGMYITNDLDVVRDLVTRDGVETVARLILGDITRDEDLDLEECLQLDYDLEAMGFIDGSSIEAIGKHHHIIRVGVLS